MFFEHTFTQLMPTFQVPENILAFSEQSSTLNVLLVFVYIPSTVITLTGLFNTYTLPTFILFPFSCFCLVPTD